MNNKKGNLIIIQTGEAIMGVMGYKDYTSDDSLYIDIEKLLSDDCWNNPCVIIPFAHVLVDSRECSSRKV